MTDSLEEPGNEINKFDKVSVIITTILIGIIAVLTAWSGFQSAKWGDDATNLALQSNSLQSRSSEASLTANQLTQIDIQIFIEWLNATAQGQTKLAGVYQQRMRDEAKPAFNAWLATDPFNNKDAPTSPFVMPEYVLQSRVKAQQLADQSAAFYNDYQIASRHSTDYLLVTVVLAAALFFTGLSTRIGWRQIELALVAFAVMLLAYGIYRIIILK